MPATVTHAHTRGEGDVGRKGSVLCDWNFSITFMLGWWMVLVAAAYLIMKQRRRRLARSEATEMEIGRVNSQNEHENSLHSGRAEMHDATPRTILSEGVPVREPLPVQMPGETISWQDDVEGFRRIRLLTNEVRAVLNHVMDIPVDTSTYLTGLAEAGVGPLMPIDAGGLYLCGV